MLRNLAIALSFSAMAAIPAQAVTITPDASASSLNDYCTVTNGGCSLNLPGTRVKIGSGAGNDFNADPFSSFQFLVFKANGNDRRGDSFEADATLAFRVQGSTVLHYAKSLGTGFLRTSDSDFTRFRLEWAPIANILVAGVGTFAVSFQNVDLTADDSDDSNGGDSLDKIYVRANVTQISAVPLPAGMWLLGSALVALGAARLRRRATA